MNPGIITGPNNRYVNRVNISNRRKLPDISDFTIRFPGNPKYIKNKIVEIDPIEMIVQKLEMLLLTNKGEVIGDPNFGANLEYYIWETTLAQDTIENEIREMISVYIPELVSMGYDLEITFYENDYRDIMQLNFNIQGYNYLYIWA